MNRILLAAVAIALTAEPALADGWTYDSKSSPMAALTGSLHSISNGAAAFLCGPGTPLSFVVEISYDISQIGKRHPPTKVTWIVDDKVGDTGMWMHQGLYVFADPPTTKGIADAARTARAYVGIQSGKLTSLFDVRGLASGLGKLEGRCAG